MPIAFDLEAIRSKYSCVNYLETGLWDPRTEVSSKAALRSNFKKIYCIELRHDWVQLGNEVFKKDIDTGRYTLIQDDSANLSNTLNKYCFSDKTLFFLDSHVDNANITNFKLKCPLFDELNAIKTLARKDNIILIDDLRVIKEDYPWGETTYGRINFLQKIKELVLEINPSYKFDTLDGHIKDDVLLCYV
jgi:hypothetical protein